MPRTGHDRRCQSNLPGHDGIQLATNPGDGSPRNRTMTVSVCIPTYNSAQYLRETIASVLAQTFTDFELIVCDNGSTDGTCEIARSFSDPRIQLQQLAPFAGMAGNFNHAITLARGKYVKFLCYDDLIEPACLEKQVAMLEKDSSLALVTTALRCIDAAGKNVGEVAWMKQETILRDVDVITANLVYGNFIGIPSATLIRGEALAKAGPFSENFPQMMDVEMYLRLIRQGQVGFLPERLCAWRLHAHAMTTTYRKTGVVRRDMRLLTEEMLRSVSATWSARRVAWGRVAGSYLSQAMLGLRHGYLKWPLAAAGQAFLIDPFFLGLAAFVTLFRTGVLGLATEPNRRLRIRTGRTLGSRA